MTHSSSNRQTRLDPIQTSPITPHTTVRTPPTETHDPQRRTVSPPQRPNNASTSNGPRSQPKKIFTTILITDSLMRHLTADGLGTNHKLIILNKTDCNGLSETRLRSSIREIKPDFIYIHLGINDFLKNRTWREVNSRYGEFSLFISDHLPQCKVVFSLPLPTDRRHECEVLQKLHYAAAKWINNIESDKSFDERTMHFNLNRNLRNNNWEQKKGLFTKDGIHLTSEGKEMMLRNIRHTIHTFSRKSNMKSRPVRATR